MCTVSQWIWHVAGYFLMITTLLVVYNMTKVMGDQGPNICPPPPSPFHSLTSDISVLIVFSLGSTTRLTVLIISHPEI